MRPTPAMTHAANLGEATKTPVEQLVAFKHVEKPKGLPLAELVALFELLGLAEGLIRNENTHDEAVKQLRSKANELTEKVVTVAQHVQTGLPCWGSELIAALSMVVPRRRGLFLASTSYQVHADPCWKGTTGPLKIFACG